MATVRDLVHGYQREILTTDLQPERAAELLTKLSALVGNVLDEIREADAAYSSVLLRVMQTEEKANRARIVAETTPEYARKREARDVKELVIEMVRSLKFFLKAKSEELQIARHQ